MFTDKKYCEDEELYEFLQSNHKSHYLQSPEWAQVKINWKHERIIIRNDGKIVGTMSVLLKKVPILNAYMMYAPRGFVCDPDDKETLKKLTEGVKQIAKKYNAFIFRMDPDIPDEDYSFKETMKALGYKSKGSRKTIQPKFVYRLDIKGKTEEELLKSFKSKTRYNINLAMRKNVKIKCVTEKDIAVFYEILSCTAKRDHFCLRNIAYYERILNSMGAEHAKLFIAECENEPVAAAMAVFYGNKAWYLYGGSTDKYRNYMPTYLLQWEMIKWARSKQCDIYDFGGISGYQNENHPMYGVYRFKSGFKGDIISFTDEFYMVFKPWTNAVWNIIFKCYSRLLEIKK